MKTQSTTTKRPVGRPPKNAQPPLSPSLRAQITGQDHDHAAKENTVVLSMITSADRYRDYYSDDETNDSETDFSQTQSILSEQTNTSHAKRKQTNEP